MPVPAYGVAAACSAANLHLVSHTKLYLALRFAYVECLGVRPIRSGHPQAAVQLGLAGGAAIGIVAGSIPCRGDGVRPRLAVHLTAESRV
jgi:2-methylcitrate dehydratase PrpD